MSGTVIGIEGRRDHIAEVVLARVLVVVVCLLDVLWRLIVLAEIVVRYDSAPCRPRGIGEAALRRVGAGRLQRRVEDLEAELESVRASAKKDRDFQKQRIQALVSRVAALEGGI